MSDANAGPEEGSGHWTNLLFSGKLNHILTNCINSVELNYDVILLKVIIYLKYPKLINH